MVKFIIGEEIFGPSIESYSSSIHKSKGVVIIRTVLGKSLCHGINYGLRLDNDGIVSKVTNDWNIWMAWFSR